MSAIYSRITEAMADIDAIGKDRKNDQQGYKFRGIDDVYNELHSVLAKHKIFTTTEVIDERTEERTTRNGAALIYRVLKIRFRFFTDDGSSVESVIIGEGMDSGDKASNKALSVAHKYALLQIFAIPTADDKDPENESPVPAPKNTAPKPPAQHTDNSAVLNEIRELVSSLGYSQETKSALMNKHKGNLSAILAELKAESAALDAAFGSVEAQVEELEKAVRR